MLANNDTENVLQMTHTSLEHAHNLPRHVFNTLIGFKQVNIGHKTGSST